MLQKVAIVGAGFCGLAVAWELLKRNYHVHLYDPSGIAGGASGISAGLLHPFSGLRAKLAKEGHEGVQATLKLLEVASEAIGRPVFERTGMLRPATTEEMAADFQRCAELHQEVVWMRAQECQEKVPGLKPLPGIFIENALTVRSETYLQGLWKACEQRGATFSQTKVESLPISYDYVILTMGASTGSLCSVPITPIKGQVIELEWPSTLPPLTVPLNSQAYILMQPGNRSCLAGATFERNFSQLDPDPELALETILPKVVDLLPALQNARLLQCRSGIRASTPNHLPLMQQIDKNTWALTGMGSKGLLYHALFANKVAQLLK